MKVISVISQKGGSGKTTLSVHIAALANSSGLKVGLVDIDPQGSAFSWNETREEEDETSPKLLATKATAAQLAELIRIGKSSGMELLIVDSAPHSNSEAAIAAQLSDLVLVPCRPARFDLEAVETTLSIVKAAKGNCVVVLNSAPRGRLVEEARKALVAQGARVAPTVVYQRAALSHAVIDGRAVHEFEPDGKATAEIAELYRDITALLSDTRRRHASKA